jgi:hypothetical protein
VAGGSIRYLKEIAAGLWPPAAVVSPRRRASLGDSVYDSLRKIEFLDAYQTDAWSPDAVPALVQLLQIGQADQRLKLVEILSSIDGWEASEAIVDRAVFDLSPNVRAAAIAELPDRPLSEVSPRLFWTLRYPWAPAAVHAAEALVAVKAQDAIPELHALLDQPPVSAPHQDEDGQWMRTELVRVNHLRNCLLCHPPSFSQKDALSASIPIPGVPIFVYYKGTSRSGSEFVRADYVNLRQDFSVMQGVPNAAPWLEMQRYDYFVRDRKLSAEEMGKAASAPADDPHRAAIRYALARLESL